MGARYSDRFFGPDPAGRGAAPGADPIGPEAFHLPPTGDPEPPDHIESPSRRPRRSYRLPAVVAAASLVVGAAAGAWGWEHWRERQADAQARAAVDVTAAASINSVSPGQTELALAVRLRNDGPYALTLTALTPLDDRLRPIGDGFEAVLIEPGAESVEHLDVELACAAPDGARTGAVEEPVLAHLSTAAGGTSTLPVPGSAYGGSFDLFVAELCSAASWRPTFRDVQLETLTVELLGADALLVQVAVYSNGIGIDEPPEVLDVTAAGGAFVAVRDSSLDGEPLTGVRQITVRWSVGGCDRALVAGEDEMTLTVTGRLGGGTPRAVLAPPSPGLVAELVRLAERVCS